MELESNHHSVFLLHYHLVLVVKYRRKVFDDIVSARAREIFEYIAPKYGITVEEWNHVYFVKLRWTCSALNLDTVGVQLEHRRRLVPCFVVCLVYFMRECLFR